MQDIKNYPNKEIFIISSVITLFEKFLGLKADVEPSSQNVTVLNVGDVEPMAQIIVS